MGRPAATDLVRSLFAILSAAVVVTSACSSTNQIVEDTASGGDAVAQTETRTIDPTDPRATGTTSVNAPSGARGTVGGGAAESTTGAVPSSAPATGGTVKVGIRYIDAESVATAGQLFGLSGVDLGNPRGYAETMLRDVNARGGLAGKKIEGVYHAVDAVELALSSAAAEESACRALTEDAKTSVILSPGPTNQAFPDCTVKKKVPVMNVSYNYYPASQMKRYGPYFYFPTSMNSDRSHRAFIDGLADQGFFGAGHKLGLVMIDTPAHQQVLKESVMPALSRRGLKLHERFALSSAQDQQGYTSAVLRFSQAGITNVIFIESAGQVALYFTQRAEDQRYRPRYGFSSHASLFPIATNTAPAQLARAIGVGWVPTSDARGPNGIEMSAEAKRCLDLMRKGGEEATSDGAISIALWTCDLFDVLKASADKAGGLDPVSIAKGVGSLGDSFRPASTFATSFSAERRDGAKLVRNLGYEASCRCFRWRGAAYAPPP